MTSQELAQQVTNLREALAALTARTEELAVQATQVSQVPVETAAADHTFFIVGLTVFVLAVFVGYYVVWRVTPALHSPLMAVTNAVSSVIIVGALIASGSTAGFTFSTMMGFLAVILASVNIFGGFIVTQRMLAMYKKKQKK
jgi:H+-translocating NAD(P) transhydrogenase subunit alpha